MVIRLVINIALLLFLFCVTIILWKYNSSVDSYKLEVEIRTDKVSLDKINSVTLSNPVYCSLDYNCSAGKHFVYDNSKSPCYKSRNFQPYEGYMFLCKC